jgi:hypothetical protein
LGYPLGKKLTDRARELVDDARRWYAAHGRPWVYARLADSLAFDDAAAVVEGIRFSSPALVRTLNRSEAHAVVLVGVTAGPELEMRAQELWNEEKPDEYFFLEVFGSAVVEQLVTTVGAQLCAWADPQKMAVLPHYSPGYPEWDVADQSRLLALLAGRWSAPDAERIESFESGMLRPKKSLLAAFGLTRRLDLAGSVAELVPCQSCTYSPCDYRRAAYRRAVVREPKEQRRLELPIQARNRSTAPARGWTLMPNTPPAARRWLAGRRSGSSLNASKTAAFSPSSATTEPPARTWVARSSTNTA